MAIANISSTQDRHSLLLVASLLGNRPSGINNTIPSWRLACLICLLRGSESGSDMGSVIASYHYLVP